MIESIVQELMDTGKLEDEETQIQKKRRKRRKNQKDHRGSLVQWRRKSIDNGALKNERRFLPNQAFFKSLAPPANNETAINVDSTNIN